MDNQHRYIKGYKELTPETIALMNRVKEMGAQVGALIDELQVHPESVDPRWLAEGRTDLQKGFMSSTRSIAKPDFF